MIPRETVARILEAAKVEEVIGDYVTLKRRGANLVACCPFHNEKTPSFYVSPSKGIYKCFGCGKAGSAVGFLMEYEHLSYVEALRQLARKYHIEVIEKEETAEDIALRKKNESLMIVSEFAGEFYKKQLDSPEGRNIGYAYFKQRGLSDDTIREYGLGWAPTTRNAFASVAISEGYKEEYLIDTGLCVKYEDGFLKDRFFDRVMFPIHSQSGRVIAFGGRTLHKDKKIAKYVNSHESEIYEKRKTLYGLYFAKNAISKADKTLMVEGYLDVLSMHQKGIKNVVASSGTSLTEEQIRLIKRYSDNVTIMYDGDSAGIHAAIRGIDMVLREGMNVRVVLLPEGEDPDSYAQSHTTEEIETFIKENEQDFVNFKAELLYEETHGDPIKKAELINNIADTISGIPDAVKRSVYVKFCSEKFDIDSDILYARIRQQREDAIKKEYFRRKNQQNAREILNASANGSGVGNAPGTTGAAAGVGNLSGANSGAGNGVTSVAGGAIAADELRIKLAENCPDLACSEKELLFFILRHGNDTLHFSKDSDFYDPENILTVADFINDALEADEIKFKNDIYKNVFKYYYKYYYEGYEHEKIVRSMLDGEDRKIAAVATQLVIDKYQLTVSNFSDSLMTKETWLVTYVPRALLVYKIKCLELKRKECLRDIANASSDVSLEILKNIKKIDLAIKALKIKLGRERPANL